MIELHLTDTQEAAIAKEYFKKIIQDRIDWFNDVCPEGVASPEAVETTYEISLLKQAMEYL
jgi:hypothetical protein